MADSDDDMPVNTMTNFPSLSFVHTNFPPPSISTFTFKDDDFAASFDSNISLSFAPNVSKPSSVQHSLKKNHRKTPPSNKTKQSGEKSAASVVFEKQSLPQTALAIVKTKTSLGTCCNVADMDNLIGTTVATQDDGDERYKIVSYLLETGAYTDQQTLRVFANDQPKIIRLLLELNVDCGFDPQEYWRPLALAMAAAHVNFNRNQNFVMFLNAGMDLHMLSTMEAAIKNNLVDKVHQLLDRGFDLNLRDSYTEDQALHLASQHKLSLAIVRLLIQFGAPKHARNRRGETALNVALTYNSPDIARYLEQVGVCCSSNTIISFLQLKKVGKAELSMLDISRLPPTTSKEGMTEVIQYVAEHGGEIHAQAISEVIRSHYEPLLSWLVDLGADLSILGQAECPVIACIEKGLSAHLQTLLWHGMDFHIQQALIIALRKKYLPGMATFLDRLLLPEDRRFNQVLFNQAVSDRSWTIVRMLIAAGIGAEIINRCDLLQNWDGYGDLLSFDVFKLLVSKGMRFKFWDRLVRCFVQHGQGEWLTVMLDTHAFDINFPCDESGTTLLMLAYERHAPREIVDLLLAHGADANLTRRCLDKQGKVTDVVETTEDLALRYKPLLYAKPKSAVTPRKEEVAGTEARGVGSKRMDRNHREVT